MVTLLPVSSSLQILMASYDGTPSILVRTGYGILPMSLSTAEDIEASFKVAGWAVFKLRWGGLTLFSTDNTN